MRKLKRSIVFVSILLLIIISFVSFNNQVGAVASAGVTLSGVVGTSNIVFTAKPDNGGTPTYVWKKNGTVIPGVTGTTYTYTGPYIGDSISVEMTSSYANILNNPAIATISPPAKKTLNTQAYNNEVRVFWGAEPNGGLAVTSYEVRYKKATDPETAWVVLPVAGGNAVRKDIKNLENGTSYVFQVKAINAMNKTSGGTFSNSSTKSPAAVSLAINTPGTICAGATQGYVPIVTQASNIGAGSANSANAGWWLNNVKMLVTYVGYKNFKIGDVVKITEGYANGDATNQITISNIYNVDPSVAPGALKQNT